jgi:uncharacterized protein (DUF58 family)
VTDEPLDHLLPSSLRAALARRELLVRRPVAGARHGAHRSPRPGVGRDFRDYRPYAPGDDPRRLDWRAAARSQRLVVRQTESEEELDLLLLADGSGGMEYGEGPQRKWLRSGMVAAALSSLALRQADRVGFAIARDRALELAALEPLARRDRLHALASGWAKPARGDCEWEALLDAVAPRLRRRTLVVVVSDFLDPGGRGPGVSLGGPRALGGGETEKHVSLGGPRALGGGETEKQVSADASNPIDHAADEALLRGLSLLRAAGHDVALVQILHRDELTFPWDRQRVIELEDPRGRRPTIEGPESLLREGYLERLHAHLRWLEHGCERGGLLLSRMCSDEDPVAAVLELLGRLAGVPSDAVMRSEGGPA